MATTRAFQFTLFSHPASPALLLRSPRFYVHPHLYTLLFLHLRLLRVLRIYLFSFIVHILWHRQRFLSLALSLFPKCSFFIKFIWKRRKPIFRWTTDSLDILIVTKISRCCTFPKFNFKTTFFDKWCPRYFWILATKFSSWIRELSAPFIPPSALWISSLRRKKLN